MFQFHYALTDDDYINFNLNHALYTKTGKKTALRSTLLPLGVLASILLLSLAYHNFLLLITELVFTVLGILRMLYYKKIMLWVIKTNMRTLKADGRLPYEKNGILTFDENDIHNTTASEESRTSYSLVESVYATNDTLYIYTNAVSALILPYRFIENQDVLNNLIDFLQAKTGKPVIRLTKQPATAVFPSFIEKQESFSFRFNYTLTENDYFRFHMNHRLHTHAGKISACIFTCSTVCSFIIVMLLYIHYFHSSSWDLVIIIATVIFCCIAWLLSIKRILIEQAKSYAKKQIKIRQLSFPQNGTLTFDEQSISNVDASQEDRFSYNLIRSIYMTNEAIYIYTETSPALILPYRFIESQDVFNNLVDLLQKKTGKTIINITK